MLDEEQMLDVLIQSYADGTSLCATLDSGIIDSMCDSNSIDIRIWLARALAYHSSETQAIALLRKLSKDAASCVRVEAVDSLSGFVNQESFDILCNASRDEDELVRAYSAFGIALLGSVISPEKALKTLLKMIQNESNNRTLVNIYEGLYILGQKEKLGELICLFDSPDYRIQCAVLHALEELLCAENIDAIRQFINGLDKTAYVHAVVDTLKQLDSKCLGFQNRKTC